MDVDRDQNVTECKCNSASYVLLGAHEPVSISWRYCLKMVTSGKTKDMADCTSQADGYGAAWGPQLPRS